MSSSSSSSSSPSLDLNPRLFWTRLSALFSSLRLSSSQWLSIDSLLVITNPSSTSESSPYSRLSSIQLHLFSYEITDTLLLFTLSPDVLTIFTSSKKAKLLSPLHEFTDPTVTLSGVQLEVIPMGKSAIDDHIRKVATLIKSSRQGKKVGEIGEKASAETSSKAAEGTLASNVWRALNGEGVEVVDVSASVATLLMVKDLTARQNVERAADFTTKVMKKFAIPEMETIIDEEKSINQMEIADKADDSLHQPIKFGLNNLNADDCDSCYTPIIQSGGGLEFDLKPSAQTPNVNLQYDSGTSIIIQMGCRYKSYCSNIGRTYFINPDSVQKEVYMILTQVYIAAKGSMRVGQKMSNVYNAAIKAIQSSRKPELTNLFTKNVGFSIGLEFRESVGILNDKPQRPITKGMIFNLCVGFSGLTNSNGKPFAVLLADTVAVTDDEAESLTKMPREFKDIAYFIGDAAPTEEKMEIEEALGLESTGRTRGAGRATNSSDPEAEKARAEHQAELARRQRENALKKLAADHTDSQFNSLAAPSSADNYHSYTSPSKFPSMAKRDRIFVDVSAESLLLPIGDLLVPFHISIVKNVHKQTEGEWTYLRLNFTVPDAKTLSSPQWREKERMNGSSTKFISELTYRSQGATLDKVFFDIKELRKRVQLREKEMEAKSSLVVQEDLQIDKRGPIPTLKDVAIRPQLSRKKTTGVLAAHLNGLRFISADKMRVDIIYANVKSAFYQPAEESHQVLLHFELKNPILLDKSKTKKTNFLQFYVEVVEVSEDLSTVNRYRDEDGLLEEQEERKRRKRWNERFLNFVKEVEDKLSRDASPTAPKLEFDIPYRELAFTGVPGKSAVTIMPTVHSLVALEDSPPVVLSLEDVEIANFERVQFGLRNFDLVFVWKDFNRQPLRIDSIPIKFLDPIKHWLNSCDIVFYESNQNIKWQNVMKAINEDVEGFWQDGGWGFLSTENDDGEGEDSDQSQVESASDYEPSDDEEGEEDSEEYETPSEEESDVSSEGEEEEGDSDEDEDGEDWEELEEKAKKSDKSRAQKLKQKGEKVESGDDEDDEGEDERRPKKKGRS